MNSQEFQKLQEVKVLNNGGLKIVFLSQAKKEGGGMSSETWSFESGDSPHPDLHNALNQMKVFLTGAHGMNMLTDLMDDEGLSKKHKDAFKDVKSLVNKKHAELLDTITVTGINIDNQKEKTAIKVKGKQKHANGSITAMNTTRMRTDKKCFGFELDLDDAYNNLEIEVKEYLFEGKRPQLEIAFKDKGEKEAA